MLYLGIATGNGIILVKLISFSYVMNVILQIWIYQVAWTISREKSRYFQFGRATSNFEILLDSYCWVLGGYPRGSGGLSREFLLKVALLPVLSF